VKLSKLDTSLQVTDVRPETSEQPWR